MKLGPRQRAWLRTIAELPDSKFHWGCGQAWGTYGETVVWRGALTVEGEAGRFKDNRVWTITQAGRKALDAQLSRASKGGHLPNQSD
jgi:hypothetical protein